MQKLVLTGATGKLGSYLREPLSKMCDVLITTDIVKNIENVAINETYAQADLANMTQIEPLLEGADMVVHFGALVDEAPFEQILGPNLIGAYNI